MCAFVLYRINLFSAILKCTLALVCSCLGAHPHLLIEHTNTHTHMHQLNKIYILSYALQPQLPSYNTDSTAYAL